MRAGWGVTARWHQLAAIWGETVLQYEGGNAWGGIVISDAAVTQTDQHSLPHSAWRGESIRGGNGKDDADLVTVGLDCYRVTSFFFVTCGSH